MKLATEQNGWRIGGGHRTTMILGYSAAQHHPGFPPVSACSDPNGRLIVGGARQPCVDLSFDGKRLVTASRSVNEREALFSAGYIL